MNSPPVIAKISTATVINPLVIRGRTTRHNTTTPLAPSTTAASSSSRGMFKRRAKEQHCEWQLKCGVSQD